MRQEVERAFEELFTRYPVLEVCRKDVAAAFEMLRDCYLGGGKVLVCGNGGSAADAEHIVGELMKGFVQRRPLAEADSRTIRDAFPAEGDYLAEHLQRALPAISLVSHTALASAYINDVAADMVFAQQVYGYGRKGDVLIALSTSGHSKNVGNAVRIARAFGIGTIGMTGFSAGAMQSLCDIVIRAPEKETFKVQEFHLPIYHTLCLMIEAEFF